MSSKLVKVSKRKGISFETKIKVLNYLKEGLGPTKVGNLLGLRESTVRTIKKNENAIRQSILSGKKITETTSSYCRDVNLENMEKILAIWIEDLNQKRIPVDTATIKAKAIRLYNQSLPKEQSTSSEQMKKHAFSASGGWFSNFLQRHGFHNLKTKGEIASADMKVAQEYPSTLARIIKDGGYTPDQVFNADETGLFWKRLPNRTYVSKTQKSVGGFKVAKDRVTFLLCSNASGDRMIKPLMVNKSLKPRALKGKNLNDLPVHWLANKKAWVTAAIFTHWFNKCFVPEVKRYLKMKKQPFKVLLVIDNAPGHPILKHPNVMVVFIPPNTTSIIQPLDQGIISTFKMYYLKKAFQCILKKLDKNNELEFSDAWKSFSIMDCITYAASAISDLRPSTLNACWKSLWPECIKSEISPTENVTIYSEIINLLHTVQNEGFENTTCEDIEILHDQMLGDEELMEIATANNDSDNSSDEEAEEPTFKAEIIQEGLKMSKQMVNFFLTNDPDTRRARKFENDIRLCMINYAELHKELQPRDMQQTNQKLITEFIVKKNKLPSDQQNKSDTIIIESDQESPRNITILDESMENSDSSEIQIVRSKNR